MMQMTIKRAVSAQGVGLHSGKKVNLTLSPAAPDSGITFRRTDLPGMPEIRALWDRVTESQLCTLIAENDASVGTVEHLMAALRAANIDNVLITLDGPEVPIMDGSAEPFAFLLSCADIEEQEIRKQYLQILQQVTVTEGDKSASFEPADVPSYDFTVDFDHPAIGRQERKLTLVNGNFLSQISRARTFGFAHEVEYMRSKGLAQGGSLDNAIVLDREKILNANGLRFDDEFVRHKILDAVGDLYLAGMPILGRYNGIKAGHALNNKLLRAVFADPANYRIV
jgi:UDP-3-O-[3-hydroxymyristoyl] N-acetylglucosamine deacetylase